MTNFSLQNFLDADNPNGENSGRATLRFYVRGISKDDLLYLRETIKSRQEEFSRKIKESLKGCEKDGVICVLYIKKLTALQLKFQEFQRSVTATKVIGS